MLGFETIISKFLYIPMKIKLVFITLILTLATGCAEVTESSAKVLDSAGSVTRSVSEKAWIANTPTPEPTSADNLY
jgi:hypothetical protein